MNGMNSLFSLEGMTAAVTGAAGLLGAQHCKALAEAGADVIACDLDPVLCGGVIKALPRRPAAYEVNIADKNSVIKLKDFILAEYGKIDILVNNAAVNDRFESPEASAELSKFENYPLELWQRSIDVNITGTFLCCQILGSEMAKRHSGSIINIASTYAVAAPDQNLYKDENGAQHFYKSAAYPVSKAAVLQLTKFLAAYWGKDSVRVNALSPGGVENNQDRYFINNYSKKTPLGRMAVPEDYMGALVFLAGSASAYMTGANLIMDGGFTIW